MLTAFIRAQSRKEICKSLLITANGQSKQSLRRFNSIVKGSHRERVKPCFAVASERKPAWLQQTASAYTQAAERSHAYRLAVRHLAHFFPRNNLFLPYQ